MTNDYMLRRDKHESKRLDFQHEFTKAMGNGRLLHPSIPLQGLKAIADVGTGTGIWLDDIAESLQKSTQVQQSPELVGFDVSAEQFPPAEDRVPEIDLVVHDMTTRYPEKYHGRFDVVNIRYMEYALKESDLEKTVENIAELLRPGGYIQWQEIDIIDVWATPATKSARDAVLCIIREKFERGLTLSTPTQIVKALLAPALRDEEANPNSILPDSSQRHDVLSWDSHLLRLCSLETISTSNHPSPKVQAEKDAVGLAINTQLLLSGAARMRGLMQQAQTTKDDKTRLAKRAQENEDLAEAIKVITNQNSTTWNADLTWIVAKKAIVTPLNEDWMSAKRAYM